jgi:polysaccharide biosynthesis transport protein
LAPMPASANLPTIARDPYAQVGYGADFDGGGLGAQFWEYWRIFYKRRWLILSLALAVLVLGGLKTLMETPLYTSTVRLQIDRSGAKPLDTGEVRPAEGQDQDFLRTQFELLLSRSMAERVASSLKLGDDKEFLQPANFSILGTVMGLFRNSGTVGASEQAVRERRAAAIIMENRAIRPLPGSRLVDVSYVDTGPARAQRIANAMADAYIASNIDKRFEANSYARTFLEDQTKQLKIKLEDSEKIMIDFAQREKIVATNEKASIAENNLASANAALGTLISERIKNEQLWRQVDSADQINLPQLLTNAVIDGLRGRRNALTTEYQEKLETFKPDYPQMVQIKNKIAEINRQLATEIKTIKASYKAAFEAASKQEADMKLRVDALKTEVLDLQQRSIQYNILKREVDSNRSLYEGLLQRFKQVDIAGGVGANNVYIVDKAEIPGSPSSPRLARSLMLSLAFGLFGGIGLAVLLEHLDDTIRTVEALERAAGIVTLGIIPRFTADKAAETEMNDPRSITSEAYRSLATALQFSTEQGLPRMLMITSAGPGEGKSSTALAIARHFAGLGLRVLIIDADMRKPSLHTKLQMDNALGLSNTLTGACRPQDAMRWTTLPSLAAVTAGPVPPNPAELLGSARLTSLLTEASERFDLVVIDTPPIMGLADAPIIASSGAATIFVAGAGQARVAQVRTALRRLQLARAHILGVALTKFDAEAAGYGYGYGDGGYGGYGYGQEPAVAGSVTAQAPQHLTNASENRQWTTSRH